MGDNDAKYKKISEEDEDKDYKAAMKKLVIVSFVSTFFVAAQLFGGYMANSIAIFADTAHLASDMIGFIMSMISLKLGTRGATNRLTYGWRRAEIMGTLLSVFFLLSITVALVIEAFRRLKNPEIIDGTAMAITAVGGLCFNLIQMKILGGHDHGGGGHDHGHSHGTAEENGEHSHAAEGDAENINVKSAYLHVLGDTLMSVGVIVASTVIFFQPTWTWADPVCTFFFSIIVCVTCFPTLMNCMNVLLEGAPLEFDI
jgi:cation diffusion facilitator family transporter